MTREPTVTERFELMLAGKLDKHDTASVQLELRHVAEHLGMGDMRQLCVTVDEVREFFGRLPPGMQLQALTDIETCPW